MQVELTFQRGIYVALAILVIYYMGVSYFEQRNIIAKYEKFVKDEHGKDTLKKLRKSSKREDDDEKEGKDDFDPVQI